MSNKIDKPMLTPHQLIAKMRDEKGITFQYVSENEAETYLSDVNNYLRVSAYRQNYQKYTSGQNKGKYIDLDFSYLQELSTIDMHLRFLLSKMCSDIEHALKVQLVTDIVKDPNEDGYDIVKRFLDNNPSIVNNLARSSNAPFTEDLLKKYFTLTSSANTNASTRTISGYDDCPVWVLCEFLSFGDVIRLYNFYHQGGKGSVPNSILNTTRFLRNATAHNNCILGALNRGTSRAPKEINMAIQMISSISKSQAKKKLSCRPMLELVSLFYVYNILVTGKIKYHRVEELKWLFFERMPEKKDFFLRNQLITSNYDFICKVIKNFFT